MLSKSKSQSDKTIWPKTQTDNTIWPSSQSDSTIWPQLGGQTGNTLYPSPARLIPLAAKYNGGKELHDAVGHLPRDAEGYYLSRITGERLLVDAGYSVGDTVGEPRLYTAHGSPVGTVLGQPATGRRSGFNALSGSDYATVTISENNGTLTFIGRVEFPDTLPDGFGSLFMGDDGAGNTNQLYAPTFLNRLELRIREGASTPRALSFINNADIGTGWRWVVATIDTSTGTTYLAVYSDDGTTLLDSDTTTDPNAILNTAGLHSLGAYNSAAVKRPWAADVGDVLGLDGVALDPATCETIVADLASGTTTIDDYASTFQLPTDGLICGAYDPAIPTFLPELSGTGADVTVEQPVLNFHDIHPLVAVYGGGVELHDDLGHLPRLGNRWYTNRNGVPLLIDNGYEIGDEVGEPKLYGLPGAVVTGTPASGRRSGLGPFAVPENVAFQLDSSQHSFLARVDISSLAGGATRLIAGRAAGPFPGWLLLSVDNRIELRLYSAAGTEVSARCILFPGATGEYWVAASTDGTTQTLHLWAADGTGHVQSQQTASTPQTLTGTTPYLIGGSGIGIPLDNMAASEIFGWDGALYTQTQFEAVIADVLAGSTVDDVRANYPSDLATDGLICGTYDFDNPTELFEQSASGIPVYVNTTKPKETPFAVRYNGGKELHDALGHLPRDAEGYYLSRITGERLLVDAGYSVGDTVGEPKIYGLLTATVVGVPATGRRSGFDAFDDLNYALVQFDTSKLSFAVAADTAANTFSALFDGGIGAAPDRAFLGSYTAANNVQMIGGPARAVTVPNGYQGYCAGYADGDTGSGTESFARTYTSAGLPLASGTATDPATSDFRGVAYLGRQVTAGRSWGSPVHVAMGWDGTILSPDELDAVIADIHAGTDVDTLRGAYGAQLATDGLICGAYDPADPTVLYSLSGSGADVTVVKT